MALCRGANLEASELSVSCRNGRAVLDRGDSSTLGWSRGPFFGRITDPDVPCFSQAAERCNGRANAARVCPEGRVRYSDKEESAALFLTLFRSVAHVTRSDYGFDPLVSGPMGEHAPRPA